MVDGWVLDVLTVEETLRGKGFLQIGSRTANERHNFMSSMDVVVAFGTI